MRSLSSNTMVFFLKRNVIVFLTMWSLWMLERDVSTNDCISLLKVFFTTMTHQDQFYYGRCCKEVKWTMNSKRFLPYFACLKAGTVEGFGYTLLFPLHVVSINILVRCCYADISSAFA